MAAGGAAGAALTALAGWGGVAGVPGSSVMPLAMAMMPKIAIANHMVLSSDAPAAMVPPQRRRGKHVALSRRAVILAPLALAVARSARAEPFRLDTITVFQPWAKPSVGDAAAVFMRLVDDGPRPDRLLGGTTPIAERVILREYEGSALDYYDLLPRRPVILRPGRRYIALRGLKRLLAVDDSFPLTLQFAEAGPLVVTVAVEEGPDDAE